METIDYLFIGFLILVAVFGYYMFEFIATIDTMAIAKMLLSSGLF